MSERLQDHVDFIRGVTYGGGEAILNGQEGYLPVLRAGNIQRKLLLDSDLVWVPKTRVSDDQLLRVGDAAMCLSSGSPQIVGKSALLESNWLGSVGGFCGIVRPREQTDPFFLSCWLRSETFLKWRDKQARGANIQNLRFNDLGLVEVNFPPIKDQRRIASRLKTQMSAVEQARQLAEAQAKAAALLPARNLIEVFQSAEVEDWPRSTVGDACEFLTARSINLKGKAAVRAVTTACLLETGFTETGVKDALMMEHDVADATIEPGEILIARSNTPALVGRAALFNGSSQRLVASDLTIRLRCRAGLEPGFAAAWFSYQFVIGYWRERASGASDTMKKIGRAQLAATDIRLPPLKTQRRIAARLREQFATIQQLQAALAAQLAALDKLPGAYLREAFGSLAAALE